MHCEGGALMFLWAEHAVDPAVQGILLYMYTPDLMALHAELQRSGVAGSRGRGVAVSPISYPEYMPSGEMRFRDPDGYSVIVAHWGRTNRKPGSSEMDSR
jgi:hypothetical protein